MFDKLINFFKGLNKKEEKENPSKDTAKERLHLVLMQDRANVSADFLELMKHEIIEVIKKYIDIDENAIDVRLTNKQNEDGTNGAPALYANIPILNVRNDMKKETIDIEEPKMEKQEEDKKEKEEKKSEKEKQEKEENEIKKEKKKQNEKVKEKDITKKEKVKEDKEELAKKEDTSKESEKKENKEEKDKKQEESKDEKKEEKVEEKDESDTNKKKTRKKE